MRCSKCGKETKEYYDVKITKTSKFKVTVKDKLAKQWGKLSMYGVEEDGTTKEIYHKIYCEDCMPFFDVVEKNPSKR